MYGFCAYRTDGHFACQKNIELPGGSQPVVGDVDFDADGNAAPVTRRSQGRGRRHSLNRRVKLEGVMRSSLAHGQPPEGHIMGNYEKHCNLRFDGGLGRL